MNSIFSFLGNAKKALAAFVGAALTALTFAHQIPFLPPSWAAFVGSALVFVTAVATWVVPGPKTP